MAGRIMIVDDDQLIRKVFGEVFEESGWEVDAVGDATEALVAFEQGQYDALLVDKNMPGMSGVAFVQHVRRKDDRVVCAIFTAYPSVESAMRALQLGIDAYIEKPAPDPFWVVDKLDALVRKRAQRADLLEVSRGRGRADQHAAPVVRALVASPSAVDAGAVEVWLRNAGVDVETLIGPAIQPTERVLESKPDLFVFDTLLAEPNVPTYLETLRGSGVTAVCVVLADKAPALRAVVEFIEIEIAAVLEKPVTSSAVEERLGPVLRLLAARAT